MSEEPCPRCDGACEQHDGEVRKVHVFSIRTGHDWGALNYCAAAIAKDESKGLTVVTEGGAQ
jgi:hypothetical protein